MTKLPPKIKQKIEPLKNIPERIIDRGFSELERLIEYYNNFEPNDYQAIVDHKSLYYYKGKNVFKNIGKIALKTDYLLFCLSYDKKKLKPVIALNKALRAQEDYKALVNSLNAKNKNPKSRKKR